MPYHNQKKEFSIPPIWRLAFRPFFLGGALFSILCIAIWLGSLLGVFTLNLYGGAYWWHAHEMIFGFSVAIIVGFLLTAVQNWSGVRSINGTALFILFSLWLVARILMFIRLPAIWVALPDIAFLVFSALAFCLPQIKAKQIKNIYVLTPPLLCLALLNGLSHYALLNNKNALPYFHSAIFVVIFFMVLLGSRVIPFFVGNAFKIPQPRPPKLIEYATNISMLIVIAAAAFGFYRLPQWFIVGTALIAFCLNCIKVFYWFDRRVLSRSILWSLYAAYAFIPLGFLMLALYGLGVQGNFSLVLHSFSAGAIGGLIIAMASRVSLGHTGRPLILPPAMPYALGIIIFGGFVRVIFPLANSDWYLPAVYISGFCWLAAFGIFLYHFTPIFLQARADGKPG